MSASAAMLAARAAWLAVALPFFFSSYRVSQFTLVLAYAVAALGLNLLVGYSGQISLGHGAFFALGAYSTAILVAKSGWPHLATIPVAAAICFAAGFAFGIPALRLRGLYLALVTLGLAVATPQLIKRFDGLTGGTQGWRAAAAVPGWLELPRRRPVALPAVPRDRDRDVRARGGDRARARRPRAGGGARQRDRRARRSASTSPR